MGAKSAINLQDSYLNQIRKDNVLTTVYLVNGFQLKGLVKAFDSYTVLLDVDGKQMLIYKHAISTINPLRPVSLSVQRDRGSDEDAIVEDELSQS
ncbi:MAG: RNA chaperone Hfq [Bacillota bacterium]|nr:RNA chaperone Hfq [Candidatus Fermentithermobacillaceae bacterium]